MGVENEEEWRRDQALSSRGVKTVLGHKVLMRST